MLSKTKIKYIRSFQRKKERQRYGKFIAEGDKIVSEMLSHPDAGLECIVATPDWLTARTPLPHNVPVLETDGRGMREISSLNTPPAVLAVADIPSPDLNEERVRGGLSLFLDGIQDPGNLGAILRVADWFGIGQVFLGDGTVDAYNAKAVQASMGAFLRVSIIPMGIAALAERFPDTRLVGADMGGRNVFRLPPNERTGIIVIGNEGKGISPEARAFVKHWVGIPGGGAESLNAAVAAGIICAAFRHA